MASENPYASPRAPEEGHQVFDLWRVFSLAGFTLLLAIPILSPPMLLVTLAMAAANAVATIAFMIAGQRRLIALASLSCLCWIGTLLFTNWGFSSPRPVIRLYWPALFLSVQFLRHPDRRDSAIKFRNRLIEFVEKQPLTSDGYPDIRQLQIGSRVYSVDASDWPNYRDAGDDLSIEMRRKMIEQDAIFHAKMLMNKRWSIVFIDEPLFVTSEYPIYVPELEFARHQIGSKNAVVLFPISPTRILCFDDLDEPANQYYPIANSNSDMYNTLTWVNTDSFMISSRNIEAVLAGINRARTNFELNMIHPDAGHGR